MDSKKPVTFLLRNIDRKFWAKVKARAANDQITIRELIINAIKDKLKTKRHKI